MVATLAALLAAVVLALAYVLLTERMDEASLARRRLDAWVFVGCVGCLVTMLYGGAAVARSRALTAVQVAASGEGPTVIERRQPVSLVRGAPSGDAAFRDDDAAQAQQGPGSLEASPGAVPEAPSGVDARPYVALRGERPASVEPETDVASPLVDVVDAPGSAGVYTPSLAVLPPSGTSAVEPVVLVPTLAPPIPPATSPPPTPAPPTSVPSPWPSPTPFCGDPRQIVLDLDVLDATIQRGGEAPTVRYRAQVHNRSTFPVTLVDVLVTLEGRDSGSERFGHVELPEVRVEPSVVHALEGTMTLTKSPSPFGTTQLCVSLIPQTCGQSVPYHLTKRCVGARGF